MIQPLMATGYEDLLVGLATWVLRGCAAWAGLLVLAAVIEAGSRGRVRATSWVATPPAVRRALLAGLGVLLAGGAPGPVSAAIVLGSPHRPDPFGDPAFGRNLPVPDRPSGRPRSQAATDEIVVRPGDTLWALAAGRLASRASDRAVLDSVHRWHARNRAVIGADPDLIKPGQRLVPPHPLQEKQ